MTHWTILLATEAVEKTAEGGLFDFDATLPVMAIQFLILAFLLNQLFYKPLGKAIDDRDVENRQNLAKAREQKEQAEALAQQYEQELRDVRRQAQEIIAQAESEAQGIVAQQVKEAQQVVLAQREEAAQAIEAQKAEAFKSLESQVNALSQELYQKLIKV